MNIEFNKTQSYNTKLLESAKYFASLSDERGKCPCGCGNVLKDHNYLSEVVSKLEATKKENMRRLALAPIESLYKTPDTQYSSTELVETILTHPMFDGFSESQRPYLKQILERCWNNGYRQCVIDDFR